ncbi:hypothetical protein Tco_1017014 [Tanacetum coccineum]|uniref:Uncharacterized protein n=1 Tax=Tanacetum coccineum TaxID=301880 RepID=A0ABQ5FQU1_9ASTR
MQSSSSDSSNNILKSISSLLRELIVGSHESAASDVNVSLQDYKMGIQFQQIKCLELIVVPTNVARTLRRDKVYNWETATYGKIWDNEDVHDLGSVETEFPAIVFNDTLTSEAALCGPREGNIDEYWWRIYKSGKS